MTPAANYAGARLCAADAIPDGGAREVYVGPQDDPLHVVLFRRARRLSPIATNVRISCCR